MKNIILTYICLISLCFSQNNNIKNTKNISPIIIETIPVWTDSSEINLNLLYKINTAFFVITKSNENTFTGKGEVIIELQDSSKLSIQRKSTSFTIGQKNASDYLFGNFFINIKPGQYNLIVELKDLESGKIYSNQEMLYNFNKYGDSLTAQHLSFTKNSLTESINNTYSYINGNNINLGSKAELWIQAFSPDTQNINTQIKIIDINTEQTITAISNANYKVIVLNNSSINIESDNNQISLKIKEANKNFKIIRILLPLQNYELGSYKIITEITQANKTSSTESFFNIVWPNKPKSLSNFKIAVDALKYIASDEEVSNMNEKSFKEFWNKRSPDTSNMYNPVMAEYYRRVDIAINKFSTTNKTDGYKTDRGRILILFGTPSITNKILMPSNNVTELWIYEKLKKRFTFIDSKKDGNFILEKTESY